VFIPVEKHIENLKGRGMVIADQKKAGIFLLMNNYVNVINTIGRYFYGEDNWNFREGTDFNEIVAVFYYDAEVKEAIFKAILNCESHLRSVISYIFSQSHPEKDNYLDQNNFFSKNKSELEWLNQRIRKVIADLKKENSNNALKNSLIKNNTVPIWKLINYIDFATLKNFYSVMLSNEKESVAQVFTNFMCDEYKIDLRLTVQDIDAMIQNIYEVRNLIAHNNRLLGFQCAKTPPYLAQLHQTYGILSEHPRTDIFNTLILLKPFIERSQFTNLYNTLLKRSRRLEGALKTIHINVILCALGFNDNFHDSPKLSQP